VHAMKNRREVLKTLGFTALTSGALIFAKKDPMFAHAQENATDLVTEMQRGDPDDANEYVTFSPKLIQRDVLQSGKALFESWQSTVPKDMVSVARRFIGKNRQTDAMQITEFLNLFSLPFKTENAFVPFCAAGLSYCALLAYTEALTQAFKPDEDVRQLRKLMPDLEHYYFYPTVSCVDMYHIALGKRHWIDQKANRTVVPRTGWIVLFDWNKSGSPNHCGLVRDANQANIFTIEFNTSPEVGNQRNGGAVEKKTRTYEYVVGFVVTDTKP
jgi:hypothetical protein